MEIHAPERHVQSARDIILHLAIVTVGILIALGLEQAVEWYHHRELVAEARETILSEIRSNQKELKTKMAMWPRFQANDIEILDFIGDLLDHGKSDRHNLRLAMSQAQIRGTSWLTAQTVGALAFMPYADVEKYASVYRRQEDFLAAQNRTQDAGVGAFSVFSAGLDRLKKLSHSELEAERARMLTVISALTVQIQFADALNKAYDDLLPGKTESAAPPLPASPRNAE